MAPIACPLNPFATAPAVNPALRQPAFARLWLCVLASYVSFGGDFVLVGWLAQAVTGDPGWVGAAFALLFLPLALLGAPAGSTADRFDRHRLLKALELVAAAVMVAAAAAFALGEAGLVHVLAMPLALGVVRALQNPVRLALAYDIAGPGQATVALAAISVAMRLGMIAGAPAAGALAEAFGMSEAFLFMAGAHLAAWAALDRRGPAASGQVRDPAPLLRNLRESAAELRRNRVLLALVLTTAAIEVFGTSFSTLVPQLVESRLALGAEGLGWMFAAQAGGALLAGLAFIVRPPGRRLATAYGAVVLALAAGIALLAWAADMAAMLAVLALIAGAIGAWDILTQSMVQLAVPNRLRGRAMGVWVFAIGSAPLGHLQIGLLATAIGTGPALLANGLAVAATVALAFSLSRSLRRL